MVLFEYSRAGGSSSLVCALGSHINSLVLFGYSRAGGSSFLGCVLGSHKNKSVDHPMCGAAGKYKPNRLGGVNMSPEGGVGRRVGGGYVDGRGGMGSGVL